MKHVFIVIILSFIFSGPANAENKTITINKWVDVSSEILPESKPIKSECSKIEFTEESKNSYKPEFPSKALQKKIQGYSILEFTIDASGKTLLTETILSNDKTFENQAIRYLKKLKFVTPSNWSSTCEGQVYRIGYAFRILSDCNGKEFQKPIINICTVGMIAYQEHGRWVFPNIKEE